MRMNLNMHVNEPDEGDTFPSFRFPLSFAENLWPHIGILVCDIIGRYVDLGLICY